MAYRGQSLSRSHTVNYGSKLEFQAKFVCLYIGCVWGEGGGDKGQQGFPWSLYVTIASTCNLPHNFEHLKNRQQSGKRE